MAEYSPELHRKYEKLRNYLCNKHDKRCLTSPCPLSKGNCYTYHSIKEMFDLSNSAARNKFIKIADKVAEDEGYKFDQGVCLIYGIC